MRFSECFLRRLPTVGWTLTMLTMLTTTQTLNSFPFQLQPDFL